MIHKYTYGVRTFFENKKKYGRLEALKEDWYMTKVHIEDIKLNLIQRVASMAGIPLPFGFYTKLAIRDFRKERNLELLSSE